MVWAAPTSKSSGGRLAVHTSSGTPADSIVVKVDGVVIDPSRYVVDYATNTIGVFDSYVLDQAITVEITRYTLNSAASATYIRKSVALSGA